MATKIQLRRDTAAQWTANNPTLSAGELGYETDTKKVKIGNGSDAWNSLSYIQIELGTDTTGNYVATVSGTSNQVSVSGSGSESASVTISLPQDIATTSSPTFAGATLDAVQVGVTASNEIDTSSGNLTIDSAGGTTTVDDNLVVNGDLTVSGTTTTVSTEEVNIADNIIVLNSNATGTPNENAGVEIERGDSANVVLRWNESLDTWEATRDGTNYYELVLAGDDIATSDITDFTEDVQDVVGGMVSSNTESGIAVSYDDETGKLNFDVNDPTITLSGDVTGTATMTDLGNVTITTTVAADSVALGTDTTGDYVESVSGTDGVSITGTGEGATVTVANTDKGSSQNIFKNVAVSGQNSIVADSNNDTLTFAEGTGITLTTDSATDTLTVTNAGVTSVNSSTGAITNVALTTGKLSQFAATTSSELAGVVSDETGTGALVFAGSPTLTGTPAAPTANAGTNTTQIATTAFVQTAVSNLVDSAPTTLDTLNELAAALNDDPNFATTVTNSIAGKQPLDADLTAIASLAGTSGFLKKTAADTWTLDTNTYLTGNQTITLTGDVSGSGTTSITVTVADDSHNHIISNVDGLQDALDLKAPLASPTFTGTVTAATLDLTTANTSTAASHYWVATGSDGVVRPKTLANVISEIVTTSAVNSAAATTVGTVTSGTWEATDIGLSHGGTNASLTAVNGGVVYSTASAMAITAAGTAGQVLTSNGAGAPTWSTPSAGGFDAFLLAGM